MTPTEQDKELEVALMELFCRSEEFGRVFLTGVSKEEFAKSVNDGALDHQQAAHEAMQLIIADRKRVALEEREKARKFYAKSKPQFAKTWVAELSKDTTYTELRAEKTEALRPIAKEIVEGLTKGEQE